MAANQQAVAVAAAGVLFTVEITAAEQVTPTATVEPCGAGEDAGRLVRVRADGLVTDFTLRWDVPAVDMHGVIMGAPALTDMVGLPFWQVERFAAANHGIPFACLFHRSGANRLAVGLIDQLTETQLHATLSEETRCYHFVWRKPVGLQPENGGGQAAWEECFFVSQAARPWPEVLGCYRETVDREWPQPRLAAPAAAFDPVFCSWTAVHHAVSQAWVERTAALAAELGFGTWLTDDGWFTDQGQFADYRYTGDWVPWTPKFPDLAAHVRRVQALGLRYILWVAPFMVGDASTAAAQRTELLLAHNDFLHCSWLSPWRRATATVVGDLLQRLVADYGLDGLKLDFIDSVRERGERPAGADFPSLGDGLYTILCEAVERVAALRPGLLIELRNPYSNLAGRRYGNLFRASDVPINFQWNRWQVVLLRLLAPDRAVHLDPALWHPDDTDENVAVHLINLLASVPMVSVDLEQYPPSHLALIRHWIGFYREHRDTLVHGTFAPEFRLGHVPLIRFGSATERIVGVYDDVAFALGSGVWPVWVLNASTRPYLEVLDDELPTAIEVAQFDKFGTKVSETTLAQGTRRLPVEAGGYLTLRKFA